MSDDKQSTVLRAKTPRPRGPLKVVAFNMESHGSVLHFSIALEDEHGARWATDHDVFKFELEHICDA